MGSEVVATAVSTVAVEVLRLVGAMVVSCVSVLANTVEAAAVAFLVVVVTIVVGVCASVVVGRWVLFVAGLVVSGSKVVDKVPASTLVVETT